ncbi:MAG: prenyltransferase [Kofleriaceae bacterium]
MTGQALISMVRLGRPLFLVGGVVLYGLGTAIAVATGHAFDPCRYALGQAAVTAFQLMTHYANEYFDFEADRANTTPTTWSGGSRVLIGGALPRSVALIAAIVLAGLGGVATLAVAMLGERFAVIVLLATATLAWTYSAPPLRLCARGLGELTTAVVVTILVPLLGFQLQAPELDGVAMLAGSIAHLALLQFAMLLAIEFPDAAGDAATGKRTLVVRLGARAAARLYAVATALALVLPGLAVAVLGAPVRVAIAGAVIAPLGLWRAVSCADCLDPRRYERLAMCAVALVVAMAIAQLLAWLA